MRLCFEIRLSADAMPKGFHDVCGDADFCCPVCKFERFYIKGLSINGSPFEADLFGIPVDILVGGTDLGSSTNVCDTEIQ